MSKDKQEKLTKVFIEDYKGNQMFSIWEVNEDGEKTKAFPIISFGKTKAEALIKHKFDLEGFAGVKDV